MRRTLLFIVGLGIILTLSGIAAKGSVVIQELNSPADLNLSGDIVYAINFGNNGNPNVGGVVFSQDENYPAITLDVLGEGPATWWGPYPGTGDAGLNILLNGLAYRYGTPPNEVSVSAGGLLVGKPYILQIIGYEPENQSRNIDIFVENNKIVTGYNPLFEQGGVVGQGGSVIKYDFIANDSILNIRLLSYANACAFSGFILTESRSPGDLTGDSKVDIKDLLVLASYWLQDEPFVDIAPPINGDGIVNLLDFAVLAEHWLEGTM